MRSFFTAPRLVRRGRAWQLDYLDVGGRRRRLSVGRDLDHAQRLCVRASNWLVDGLDPEAEIRKLRQKQQRGSMTLSQFFTTFLRRHGALQSPNMRRSYQMSFRSISRCPQLAHAELAEIDRPLVLAYLHGRVEAERDPVSAGSANVEGTLLKTMLSRATEWGFLPSNPLAGMSLLPYNGRRDVNLSVEEARGLISSLKEPLASVVEFALATGFRKENILGLRIEAVLFHDLDEMGEAQLTLKGGRTELFPLGPAAVAVLKRVIGKRKGGYVFVSRGNARLRYIDREFTKAVESLGLTATNGTRLRFHDLRHLFAGWLHREGVSLDSLRSLLGHRDRATSDRYTFLDRLEVGRVLSRLPNLRENPHDSAQLSGSRKQGASASPADTL